MFVSDRFLYLHLPKTGGWTVRRILEHAQLPRDKAVTYSQHSALHEIPSAFRDDKQLIASVREPCAWYRSYFHYNVRVDGTMSPFIARLLGGKPFELKRALHTLLFKIPFPTQPMQVLGIRMRVDPVLLGEREIGLYTWMVHHQLGARPNAEELGGEFWLLDTDQVRIGLHNAMDRLGHDITPSLEAVGDDNCNADLVARGKRLLPYTGSLLEDFDEEMVEWVYNADRRVADLMGYSGPGSTTALPLVRRS